MSDKLKLLSEREHNFMAEGRILFLAEALAEERYKRMVAERAADYVEKEMGLIRDWRTTFAAEIDAELAKNGS